MIHIPNRNNDPALNLAMEEFILSSAQFMEPVLFFYVNSPSVIIGRHQNTLDEIDSEFVKANHIQVVRRCSGGGAVYHDLGNLNYSLILPEAEKASSDFSVLLVPIRDALQNMGLPAEINGRNDLTVNGVKFSGNAYYHNRYGSVTHGTLLYDPDMETLSKALRPDPEKLRTKGVKSVISRVCGIKSMLPQIGNIFELEAAILDHFFSDRELRIRGFTADDMAEITEIANNRYRNDSWNYGESPAFTIRRLIRQPSGWIDFRADIREDKVRQVRFFGDFFCTKDISDLETSLIGKTWQSEQFLEDLTESDWESYFPDYPAEEFIRTLFNAQANV